MPTFWNIMPPSSGIIKPFLQTTWCLFKITTNLNTCYWEDIIILYIVLFFSYFCIDQAFYESGSETTVLSFLKMYVFSFTLWIGNSITYKENSGLSHCGLKGGCSYIGHRSRVGMRKLHELITDLYFNTEWVLHLND